MASAPSGHTTSPQADDLSLGLWIGAVGIGLSTAFLMLRIYTKITFAKAFGSDDVLATLSWLFAVGLQTVLIYLRTSRRLGVHLHDLTASQAEQASLLIFVATLIYISVLAFAKASLLISFRHLASQRWLRLLNLVSIVLITAYSLAFMFILTFGCSPIRKSWDVRVKSGSCIDRSAIYLAMAAADSATILILLLLPIPILVKLRTTISQKVGLLSMYAVGGLTLAVSCVRLVLLLSKMKNTDMTWEASTPAIWTSAEVSLVVIFACLPTLPQFAKHVAPRWFSREPLSYRPDTRDDFERPIRMRPASALSIFKGRSTPKQVWRQMPEEEMPEIHEKRAPMRKANKQDTFSGFDFGLEKQEAAATTREVRVQGHTVKEPRDSWL